MSLLPDHQDAMTTPSYDIAILGSGPVGCALALALARHAPDPGRILLAGPMPAPRPAGQAIDPRALAMNHGSHQFLDSLNAWPAHAAAITHVHVSQAHHVGQTQIDHADLGVAELGCVVRYDELLERLHQALEHSGVQRLLERPSRPLAGTPVQLPLKTQTLTTRVALLSDGVAPSGLRREYGQRAVLATIRASRPRPGWAFERFTREGPLALLPHPADPALYSLVWCVPPARAEALLASPAAAFAQALQQAFGQRLGTLRPVGDSHTFPLSLHVGPQYLGPGVMALGNAAQTLHPVAGQGLNLGLRDVAQLAHALGPWLARPQSEVSFPLRHYMHKRRLDRGLTVAITDTLPRVFATKWAPLRHACSLGLMALELLPMLRRPLARHLMQGQRR
ncbi:FAD-dependent monooxygenase [Castellaniella sp.]|uniref:FAD-dependent monooxygenase n=1 Tax=Castellaniella sp. TaxID=1955812 RepID=UPI0035613C4A